MHTTELDVLRRDAELHNLDTSRVKIRRVTEETKDGQVQWYAVDFPNPCVVLGETWSPGVPTGTVRCRSAERAEEIMLAGLLRLTIAERRCVRMGAVCGWDGARINRHPLSDSELAAYLERTGHSAKVAQLQKELGEALSAQAAREAAQRGSEQLAERYGLAASTVPTSEHPSLSGKPAKRQRASRKEVKS